MKRRIRLTALCLGLVALCTSVAMAQERWVYLYNGPGSSWDQAYSIVVGPDGNVYVAGMSEGVATDGDFTVVSLTSSGAEQWVYRYSGSASGTDRAYSIAADTLGNLYAAGYSAESGTAVDFIIVSITSAGVERWIYRYDGPGNSVDRAYSIITGPDGNLYAAGLSSGIGTSEDFTVVSLTNSGVERWVYRYNGPADSSDVANSIVVGTDGNIYVAGSSFGSGTHDDFTVVSLNDSGTERWVYRYNGTADTSDEANSIVVGMDGNIYAAGYSWETGTHTDLRVVSLTDSGAERWVYTYNGGSSDRASSVTMGSDGNLYAAGRSYATATRNDFAVVSITSSGAERWVYKYDGPASGYDVASSVAMGSDGNLYAAGCSWGSGTFGDFTVVSVTDSGAERWVYRYSGTGNVSFDRANSIVKGLDGNLYAAGISYQGGGIDDDFTVVSLSPDVGVNEEERKVTESPILQMSITLIPGYRGARVSYSLPDVTQVRLSVYDISGRLVRDLVDATEERGSRVVFWDGTTAEDREVGSGTYFVRLEASGSSISRKLLLF